MLYTNEFVQIILPVSSTYPLDSANILIEENINRY